MIKIEAMIILLTILLTLSVLFEGTVTTLPLTLICLVCFAVLKRDTSVFLPAFLEGLFIDIFRVQQVGATSIFYIAFLFLILLYKKKYEIYSSPFVLIATFLGTFLYLHIFGHEEVVMQSAISSLIALLLFMGLRIFTKNYYETRLSLR